MHPKCSLTSDMLAGLDDFDRLIEENGSLRGDLIETEQRLAIARAKLAGKEAEIAALKREIARLSFRDVA